MELTKEPNIDPSEITTILGEGSSFDGKLTFEGAVRIDGVFAGEITTVGLLIIGRSADVRANIDAGEIRIEGSVHGDLQATTCIEVASSARVFGNLHTKALQIARGALFEGQCHMASEDVRPSETATMTNGQSPSSPSKTERAQA